MPFLEGKLQVSIVILTYNERANVRSLYDAVHSSLADQWCCELIYVDDNSPDGAAEEIRWLPTQPAPVKLLERPGKMGLGSVVLKGFRWRKGTFG